MAIITQALMCAESANYTRLLTAGADVDTRDPDGATPLHLASFACGANP